MENFSSKRNGRKPSAKTPQIVPFQGMGTRLRRSRSKDHSNEHDDNLAHSYNPGSMTMMMGPAFMVNGQSEGTRQTGLKPNGTLDRPKRLYNFTVMQQQQQQPQGPRRTYDASSDLIFHNNNRPPPAYGQSPQNGVPQQRIYGTRDDSDNDDDDDGENGNGRGGHPVHQYEEPHLIMNDLPRKGKRMGWFSDQN